MTPEEKKDLERDFTKAFLKTIGIADFKDLMDSEEPDFLLMKSELLGIEVTELYTEAIDGHIQRIRIEGGWDGVLELAHKLWHDESKPKVDVRIILNDTIHIPKITKAAIAKELIAVVERYLPNPGESFWSQDDIQGLPYGIVDLHIHRYSEMEYSTWRFNDVAWTPHLSSGIVQNAITKKEFLRDTYLQNCNKIWLLLVMYPRRPSGSFIVPENFHHKKFQFDFDKVFLFNAFPAKTWELQQFEKIPDII